MSVTGMTSSTSGTGTSAWLPTPADAGEQQPGPAARQQAERQAYQQRRRGQRDGLPGHDPQQLGPEQAEGLEHREVAPPPPHPGEQHVGERPHREQGQDGTQDEWGVPDPGVVLDVAGPLVGGHQA